MSYKRHLFFWICSFLLMSSGCSKPQEHDPGLLNASIKVERKTSETKPVLPPKPSVRITSPSADKPFSCNEQFTVVCELKIQKESEMPSRILATCIDEKNREFGSVWLTVKEDSGEGRYVLEAKMKSPAKPGTYYLTAKTVETFDISNTPQDENNTNRLTDSTNKVKMRVK